MASIKLLVRTFRRLQLWFCGFLPGQPPLGMHLGFRESCRILNQPQSFFYLDTQFSEIIQCHRTGRMVVEFSLIDKRIFINTLAKCNRWFRFISIQVKKGTISGFKRWALK